MGRPAGGKFKVEMAGNKGQTSLSFDGKFKGKYPDGQDHPEGLPNGTWSVAQLLALVG
jgi:hypothetical protein